MKRFMTPAWLTRIGVAAGLVCLGLRYWLLETGLDDRGLLERSHPGNRLSWLLLGLVALLLAVSFRERKAVKVVPSSKTAVGAVLNVLGFLAAAGSLYQKRGVPLHLPAAVVAVVAAACGLWMLVCQCRRKRVQPLVYAPGVLFFLMLLVCRYQIWNSEPEPQYCAFHILALVGLALTAYIRGTMAMNARNWKGYLQLSRWTVFASLAAVPGCVDAASLVLWAAALALDGCAYPETLMVLPEYVQTRLRRLEDRGFETWAVGGCVRDALLGLEPQDYDLCTAALPEQIKEVFSDHSLVLAGEKHGTVTVITESGNLEITTFRLEGDYADNRRPGWVRFVEDVDLDLSRRDFTVNAMAYSPDLGLRDPFGGREDLKGKCLRAVGDPSVRFSEDALRILRGLRCSARYGLEPEPDTLEAMKKLAPLLDNLARERVFEELCKLLRLAKAEDLVRFAPILAQAIPELAPAVGFEQHSPYHAYDVFTHTAQVVEAVPPELPLRWAALLHDVGKPSCFTMDETGRGHFLGHAAVSGDMADAILRRLKAPNALRERVVELIRCHMTPLTPDKKLLRRRLCQYGAQGVRDLLTLQRADFGGKGTDDPDIFAPVEAVLEEVLAEASCLSLKDLAVNGKDLMALGFPAGKELGACLNRLLELVLEEKIPNEKEALLRQAQEMR